MQGRLLERDGELAALDDLIAAAARGEGRLVLVEGAAGIGKSRLVAEARAHARDAGFDVVAARGRELEREFPYGVVRQLFEAVLRDELFAGAAASARAVFEPDAAGPSGDVSFATLHGLYWLALNLADDGPLLVAVDDLHWCDRPSLRFLAYLVHRLEGVAILVVGALRPSEAGADAALLAELAGDRLTTLLQPRPLSDEAVPALVSARLGADADAAFVAACATATGGNPLLL
ncbi:MAG TPA: ATP-binding protein, partial [Solirubrobacteraceae bacterium]|nr:ATP-binding protein [Solirubrobacteraceae bacterium]